MKKFAILAILLLLCSVEIESRKRNRFYSFMRRSCGKYCQGQSGFIFGTSVRHRKVLEACRTCRKVYEFWLSKYHANAKRIN